MYIVPFNSLNTHHLARFKIVAAVVRGSEHACFIILEVEFASVYCSNVWLCGAERYSATLTSYSVFKKYWK